MTPVLVIGLTLATGAAPWSAAVILGAIAVSTAPATTLALVADARARGVFVKTLLAGVALNNLACIALFETARTVAARGDGPGAGGRPRRPLAAGPPAISASARSSGSRSARSLVLLLDLVLRRSSRPRRAAARRTTSLSLVAILLVVGLAGLLDVSAPLAGLALGVTLANLTPSREAPQPGHA